MSSVFWVEKPALNATDTKIFKIASANQNTPRQTDFNFYWRLVCTARLYTRKFNV